MDSTQAGSRALFSPADRVLACERCGQPVAMPLEGGTLPCPACRASA